MAKTKPVEELVLHALKLAATNPKAKWLGKSNKALFDENEANHKAAIAECTKPNVPLLKQVGKAGGELTAAGFERVASALSAEEVATLAKATAEKMPPAERVAFLQGTIGRTPNAAAELLPLLEEATAAKNAALEADTTAKAKQAAAATANRAALERALQLSKRDYENELNAIKRLWEALGQKASELPPHKPSIAAELAPRLKVEPEKKGTTLEPITAEEKDFRRSECDRLAASWREAWDAKKDEGRDYLETAMWNIRGFRMIGETGAKAAFDGRYHESDASVFTGDPVKVVRPGWLLKEGEGDYVALKAAVATA